MIVSILYMTIKEKEKNIWSSDPKGVQFAWLLWKLEKVASLGLTEKG